MLKKIKEKFIKINNLNFISQSQAGSQMNWHMTGVGSVNVCVKDEQIDFDEKIFMANGRVCHDKKRWRFLDDHIYFERFRNDAYEQIFEFIYQNGQFVLQQPYWCASDNYTAHLVINDKVIVFTIFIHSAKKNECLRYEYVQAT